MAGIFSLILSKSFSSSLYIPKGKSNTKSKNDINNAKDAIALLEEKIKEFDDMKDEIKKLQNDTEFYQKEIEKLKS